MEKERDELLSLSFALGLTRSLQELSDIVPGGVVDVRLDGCKTIWTWKDPHDQLHSFEALPSEVSERMPLMKMRALISVWYTGMDAGRKIPVDDSAEI